MTQEDSEQHRPERGASGLGAALRAARVDKGMSEQDAAGALHLDLHTIEAIEAEDWEVLPPGPFTRGYIRAYAKLLEQDELLEQHLGRLVQDETPRLRVQAPVHTAPQMPRLLARAGLGVILVAVFGGAGWWYLDRAAPFLSSEPPAETAEPEEGTPRVDDVPDAEGPSADDAFAEAPDTGGDAAETPDAPAGEGAEPPTERPDVELTDDPPAGMTDPDAMPGEAQSDPEPSVALEDDDPAEVGGDPLFPSGEPESDPVGDELADWEPVTPDTMDSAGAEADPGILEEDVPAAEGGPDEEASLASADEPETAERADDTDAAEEDEGDSAPPEESDELVLDFAGPSWAEITDARGERLLYGLVQDEGRRTLEGEAPFSVVIGDVTQVDVYYQESEVDLGPEDAGRVVRTEVP